MKPCLCVHLKMICLLFIDDCLFFAKDESDINGMIQDLKKDFDLELESDVSAFLEIK